MPHLAVHFLLPHQLFLLALGFTCLEKQIVPIRNTSRNLQFQATKPNQTYQISTQSVSFLQCFLLCQPKNYLPTCQTSTTNKPNQNYQNPNSKGILSVLNSFLRCLQKTSTMKFYVSTKNNRLQLQSTNLPNINLLNKKSSDFPPAN